MDEPRKKHSLWAAAKLRKGERHDWLSHLLSVQTGRSDEVTPPLLAEAGVKDWGWLTTTTSVMGRGSSTHEWQDREPTICLAQHLLLTWLWYSGKNESVVAFHSLFSSNKTNLIFYLTIAGCLTLTSQQIS